MRLPEHVELGYRTISVERRPLLEVGARVGEYMAHADKIVVAEGLSPGEELHTLLHECFHAIWDSRGLRDGDDEERIVESFSAGVLELMARNPELRELFERVCGRG